MRRRLAWALALLLALPGAAGAEAVVVATGPEFVLHSAAPLEEGTLLTGKAGEILLADLAGEVRWRTRAETGGALDLVGAMPDGRHLAVARRGEADQAYYAVDAAAGTVERLGAAGELGLRGTGVFVAPTAKGYYVCGTGERDGLAAPWCAWLDVAGNVLWRETLPRLGGVTLTEGTALADGMLSVGTWTDEAGTAYPVAVRITEAGGWAWVYQGLLTPGGVYEAVHALPNGDVLLRCVEADGGVGLMRLNNWGMLVEQGEIWTGPEAARVWPWGEGFLCAVEAGETGAARAVWLDGAGEALWTAEFGGAAPEWLEVAVGQDALVYGPVEEGVALVRVGDFELGDQGEA